MVSSHTAFSAHAAAAGIAEQFGHHRFRGDQEGGNRGRVLQRATHHLGDNPVGQRAYAAVAKATDGEIVGFTYPKPGTKAPAPKDRSPNGQAGLRCQLFQNAAVTQRLRPRCVVLAH